MAIDASFPSAEEEFAHYKRNTNPAIDIELPVDVQQQLETTAWLSFDNLKKDIPQLESTKPKAGFFESAFHEFKQDEIVAHAAGFAYQKYQKNYGQDATTDLAQLNPLSNEVPKDWTPWEIKNFEGIEEQHHAYIGNSPTPSELHARQMEVHKLQQDEEYFRDGSTWGKVAGGIGAAVADIPIFMYFPIAASARYAKFGPQVVKNMIQQTPGAIAGAVAYTAAIDSTTTGKSMSDFAVDAAVNSLGGIFLTGAAHGLGHLVTGGELYQAKNALKMNFEGIGVSRTVNKDGVITGLKTILPDGMAQNAAEATRAQEFLDSQFAKNGLFKIPYFGTGVEKGLKYVSPIMRAATSEWGITRSLLNRMSDHGIEVEGLSKEGYARPDNFEALYSRYQTSGLLIGDRVNAYRNIANGVGGQAGTNYTKGLKNLAQKITGNQQYSEDAWGETVMSTMLSGMPHELAEVNNLVSEIINYQENILNKYQRSMGMEETDWNVKTAANYLSRRYDTDFMLSNEEIWNSIHIDWFQESDALIRENISPLNDLIESMRTTKEQIHLGINVEENRASLRTLKNRTKKEKAALKERIRDNEDLQNQLNERITMSAQEEKSLRNILKPWKDAKSIHKKAKIELSSAKSELTSLKSKFETGEPIIQKKGKTPTPKNYDKLKAQIVKSESNVTRLESEAATAEEQVYQSRRILDDAVESGEISSNMIKRNQETGKYKFKNPSARPKFRALFQDFDGDNGLAEMQAVARGYYTNISNTNPDKLAESMLNGMHASVTGSPLKERSNLIPDTRLLEAGFLSTDLKRNLMIYGTTLGRKASLSEALKGIGSTKHGVEGIMEELTKQYENMKSAIIANFPDKVKQAKELKTLKKSFDSEKKFHTNMLKIADGTYSKTTEGEGARNWVNALRSLTAGSKLGNVTFTLLPDLVVPIFRTGVWKWIRDGIVPAITTMNGHIKSKSGINYRNSASTAHLCLEHSINSKADQLWNYATQSTDTVSGKVAAGASKLSHWANSASLANTAENFHQQLTSNISQSNIVQSMYEFKAGTLSPKQMKAMRKYGIAPEEWADRIINQFENSNGIKNKGGGYLSEYWSWEDLAVRDKMSRTVEKSVRDTIIRKGLYDSPFISNDPIFSLTFTFTGWYFASLNRFLVPAMQRPFDVNLLSGSMTSLAMSTLIDPLRAWSRGEEFKMNDDHWFAHALSSVPHTASLYQALMRANAFIGNDYINELKNDKQRHINTAGQFGGPTAGLAQNYIKAAMMVGTGKYNQKDWKNFANSIPGIQMWYLNKFKNDFMDSLTSGLPKSYDRATGYGD